MQQKVSLYCNEKNFISHGKLLAKAKRISKYYINNNNLGIKYKNSTILLN